jgi:AcrR family transcriptional regulator
VTRAGQRDNNRLRSIPRTPAQSRVLSAAFELFAVHGVSGTSLQMIADELGVTKAAVYHQFRTKDEIVLAVAEVGMSPLEGALELAAAERSRENARELLLEQVIDLAVTRRPWVRALQNDPVMVRLLGEHEPLQQLMADVYGLLLGDLPDTDARVAAALIGAAIGGAVVNPLVADIDDETLRAELLKLARRVFGISSPPGTVRRDR